MCAAYSSKTLAKTLTYILVHAPGEHGLFWDADGTMPWKEVYWVLQEDPSLRFVRESHFKEIAYLGIEFPVYLDGKLCRLKEGVAPTPYHVAAGVPRRLYFGCPLRRFSRIEEDGLHPTNRSLVPLLEDREMAVQMARRRDPDGIVVEVETEKAVSQGARFLTAGGPLYLVSAVSASCLILPLIRNQDPARSAEKRKDKRAKKTPAAANGTPGSFLVTAAHFQEAASGLPGRDAAGKTRRKGQRGSDWKRESRKERSKREI